MPLIRLNRHPSDRQLLVFAAAWVVCFGGLAFSAYRHRQAELALGLAAAAVLVPVLGALARPILRWAFLGLSFATYPLGVVMSYVVLAVVYFVALTPIGWIMRLGGHDPLNRRPDPGRSTYWTPHRPPRSLESYFKQD